MNHPFKAILTNDTWFLFSFILTFLNKQSKHKKTKIRVVKIILSVQIFICSAFISVFWRKLLTSSSSFNKLIFLLFLWFPKIGLYVWDVLWFDLFLFTYYSFVPFLLWDELLAVLQKIKSKVFSKLCFKFWFFSFNKISAWKISLKLPLLNLRFCSDKFWTRESQSSLVPMNGLIWSIF